VPSRCTAVSWTAVFPLGLALVRPVRWCSRRGLPTVQLQPWGRAAALQSQSQPVVVLKVSVVQPTTATRLAAGRTAPADRVSGPGSAFLRPRAAAAGWRWWRVTAAFPLLGGLGAPVSCQWRRCRRWQWAWRPSAARRSWGGACLGRARRRLGGAAGGGTAARSLLGGLGAPVSCRWRRCHRRQWAWRPSVVEPCAPTG